VVVVRAFLSLLAGFVVVLFLAIAAAALLKWFAPAWVRAEGRPGPGSVFVNVGCSFLSAAAGGYVTAWAAASNPLILVLALAIIVLLMAALSALQSRGAQPAWYQLALGAISPLGVFAGGLVRLRVLGIL
jgi:hypothetical protein